MEAQTSNEIIFIFAQDVASANQIIGKLTRESTSGKLLIDFQT